jgi:hypothetical protein
MNLIKLILAFILVALGAFLLGKENLINYSNPTPSPTPILVTPTVSVNPSPSIQTTTTLTQIDQSCRNIPQTVSQIFTSKNYDDLTYCLADSIFYSRYESEYHQDFNKTSLIAEIKKTSLSVKNWQVDQTNPTIVKIKQNHPVAWSDSIIVTADNNIAFAFSLDKNSKIMEITFIANYSEIVQ